ncbi:hypothetical protein DBR17_14555 [Sphingomonas sp. HMWF008]|nr:hypothetical protein DBR17_14555 [Sphingomonas sp. HMWF008]
MLLFSDFVQRRHQAKIFEPDPAKPDEQIFAVSQASFRNLIGKADMFRNASGDHLRVQAGFVERLTPDAFADFDDGVHYVMMHQALLATIIEFAVFLFTQSVVMPDIGKAHDEASPVLGLDQPPGLQALRITIEAASIDPAQDRVRIPHCEERHRAAIYMGLLMSRFVWFHELAHCINGHVLFMRNQRLSGSLISAAAALGLVTLKNPKRSAEDQRRLRHILETDADLTALDWLLRIQNGDAENIQGLLAYDAAQRFKMTIIGTYMMTWLFEEYQRFADQTDDLTHPAPRARLAALTGMMREAATHPSVNSAMGEIEETLIKLETQLPGFQFVSEIDAVMIDDPALDAALEPYRFR